MSEQYDEQQAEAPRPTRSSPTPRPARPWRASRRSRACPRTSTSRRPTRSADEADVAEPVADEVADVTEPVDDEAATRRDGRRTSDDAAADPLEEFRDRPAREGGRLVRGAHLLRHGEQGEGQPGEPDHLAQHGVLHPRGRRADRGGRRDQERPAQAGQAHRAPRLRAGPDGPDRRVLVRRTPHAVGDRLRRAQPPAGAAEPRRGREHARPRHPGRGRGRRCAAAETPGGAPAKRPRASRSRSPTSTSPTR